MNIQALKYRVRGDFVNVVVRYNDQLSALRSDLRSCKRKTALQQKQIAEQQKQIAEQQKQTLEYANRLDDYDKKNEETSRKFQTLLQVPNTNWLTFIDINLHRNNGVTISVSKCVLIYF